MQRIDEVKRKELLHQAKQGAAYQSKPGSRYSARLNCSLPNNNSSYDNVDMNKLFRDDIMEARISVIGETDNYEVIISFIGVLEELRQLIKEKGSDIKLSLVVRAITRAFDRNDIFIHCSCPDFSYRFSFWATIDKYNSGSPEMRPAHQTNPNGDLGSCCKHGVLVLNRQVWIIKLASVLVNYIKYMRLRQRKLYEKIIEPKLFEKIDKVSEKDTEVKQSSIFDNEPDEHDVIEDDTNKSVQ